MDPPTVTRKRTEADENRDGVAPATVPTGSPHAETDGTADVPKADASGAKVQRSEVPKMDVPNASVPTATETPTLRHRDDLDGCGCVRCQGVDFDVVRRSTADAVAWSVGLVRRHPSLPLAFLLVGLVAFALDRAVGAGPAAIVGFLGVVLGRGYVGVIVAESARSGHEGRHAPASFSRSGGPGSLFGPVRRVVLISRRLPATLVGGALLTVALLGVVAIVTGVITPAVGDALAVLGFTETVPRAEVVLLVCTVVVVLGVLVKSCFLPEACFVGGYGPVEGLRASWRLTAVHRGKAIGLTAGLLALFAVSSLFDARFGDPSRPVVLSVTLRETTIPLRSLGLSTAGPLRLLLDVALSTVYYAVFVHGYLGALFADEAS